MTSRTGAEAARLPPPAARATGVVEMEYGICTVEEEGAAPPWEEAVPGEEFPGGGDLDVGMGRLGPSSLGSEQFPHVQISFWTELIENKRGK